jgi:hypothetical protein
MTKDKRIFERFYTVLRKRLDDDWTADLDELNIWHELIEFYSYIEALSSKRDANIVLCFIVFAYDASSTFIEPLLDRIQVKRSIIKRLAGEGWEKKPLYLNSVLGDERGIIDRTVEWYINRQKDWRWSDWIANTEYHARATALSQGTTIDEMKDSDVMLAKGNSRRMAAAVILEEMRQDFMDIDESLKQEGKQKLTDRLQNDSSSWELFILKQNQKKDAEKRLKDAEKEVESEDGPF